MKLCPPRTRLRARHTDSWRVLAPTAKKRYHANGLRREYHWLSMFTTTKMETLEEPTKAIRRVGQVAKELPKVGRTVENDKKHVILPRRLKQGYIKDR